MNSMEMELYKVISKRIQDMDVLFDGYTYSNARNQSSNNIDILRESIVLRSIRVSLYTSVNKVFDFDEVNNDIKIIMSYISLLSDSKNSDEYVVSDVLDCFFCICDDFDKVKGLVENSYKNYNCRKNDIKKDLVNLLFYAMNYCISNGLNEYAVNIAYGLLMISEERYGENSVEYCGLTIELLKIFLLQPQICCIIAQDTMAAFNNDNYMSGDFYWFYGCSLLSLQKYADAINLFEKCYEFRLKEYGAEDWFTMVAKTKLATVLLMQNKGDANENLNAIKDFTVKIENNEYAEINRAYVEITEGTNIYFALFYLSNGYNMSDVKYYLDIYCRMCEKWNDDSSSDSVFIKYRYYYNFLGIYYMKKGDMVQAEQSYYDAINSVVSLGNDILTDLHIKINLAAVYLGEYNVDEAIRLIIELNSIVDNDAFADDSSTVVSEIDRLRIYYYTCILGFMLPEISEIQKTIIFDITHSLYKSIIDGTAFVDDRIKYNTVTVFSRATWLLTSKIGVDSNRAKYYIQAMKKCETFINDDCFNSTVREIFYFSWGILEYSVYDYNSAEEHLRLALVYMDDETDAAKATVLQSVAELMIRNHSFDEVEQLLDDSLNKITKSWHSYIRMCNDRRLLGMTVPIQNTFRQIYAILRKFLPPSELYEYLIKFKNIASFIGKERNRMVHNIGMIDSNLMSQINNTQDNIAKLKLNSMYFDSSSDYDKEMYKLRELEIEFQKQVPEYNDFLDVSIDKLCASAPDNCIIIEYFMCNSEIGMTKKECDDLIHKDTFVFDVYIVRIKNKVCSIDSKTIKNAETICAESQELLGIMQRESKNDFNMSDLDRKEQLKISLYQNLILPIIDYCKEYDTIYLSLDGEIINMPVELLCDEGGNYLGDDYTVVKLESARDFLFENCTFGNNSVIIGNPLYNADSDITSPESQNLNNNRFAGISRDNIVPLPFSSIEAERISKYFDSKYIIGKEAVKQLLNCGKDVGVIHVATHGYYDFTDETDAIYSSCLLFAGVNNWLETGKESQEYGNGLLTADEISRFDLSNVELVVLSSCFGGMNTVSTSKGFQGIIGGFSAAGAKYVISNLWCADDFASAVLMDKFYQLYRNERLFPPLALKIAKKYLRNLTIEELKNNKWFEYVLNSNYIGNDSKEIIKTYMARTGRFKPFKSEIYWAGYTCFKCN